MKLVLCLVAFVFTTSMGWAAPVETSPKPQLRPLKISQAFATSAAPFVSLRPKPRSKELIKIVQATPKEAIEKVVIEQAITEELIAKSVAKKAVSASRRTGSVFAVTRSLVPKARPRGLKKTVLERRKPVVAAKPVKYKKKGSVCGVKGIRGYSVAPVKGKVKGCGIRNPVRITEVDGITLTREALVNCDTARTLYNWVHSKAKPIIGRKGGGLDKVQLIAGYSCRTRNSKKGARLSEHSIGNAVDIAGFVMKNGDTANILRNWRSGPYASTLHKLHKSACGGWKTVLGPKSDRHHQDHFHFDIAKHRGGGTYCR